MKKPGSSPTPRPKRSLLARPNPEPPQQELFIYDIQDVSMKDSRETMVFPFLSLQKKPRFEPIQYVAERRDRQGNLIRTDTVTVTGAKPMGMATIWDFDIMLWIFGQMAAMINRGEEPPQRFGFHAYDCMRATGRTTSGREGKQVAGGGDYKQFEAALQRLRATIIWTNLAEGDEAKSVGWFEDLTIRRDRKNRITEVEVKLHDWIYGRVVEPKNILTINRDYFRLTSGIARQMYRIARKMAGERLYSIPLDDLAARAGTDNVYQFKKAVREIVERSQDAAEFPDYDLMVHDRKGVEHITFIKRKPRQPKPQSPQLSAPRPSFEIDDQSYDQAKRYCRDHELDFYYWYDHWKEKQWQKHMDFIRKEGRPPLKHPGKAFLGYLRGVVTRQESR